MMKRKFRLLPAAAAICSLVGCTAAPVQPSVSVAEISEQESVPETSEAAANDLSTVPVLAIETVSRDADAMDFVTKPAARHVAEEISSWTPGYILPPEPYYEACTITLTDPDKTVLLDAADAKVKVRGNWTTTYDKKPLRIKFEKKQNLLGLNDGAAFKNWLLLAEYKDASMLRDKSALAVAREILGEDGLYAADAAFVEVTINGEYWGMYLLTEQQQINPERVSITEAEKNYTGTDIGYFLEFDGYFANEEPLQQFHVDYADNAPLTPYDGNDGSGRTIQCLPDGDNLFKKDIGFSIKNDIYSQQQHDFIASYVNYVYRILYAAAYEGVAYRFNEDYSDIMKANDITPREAVEAVVDVASLADMYIISELTCDADLYWSSFYMSADFGAEGNRKLTFQAPWDFDSGMGNKSRCPDGTGFYAANIIPDVNDTMYETVNPWLAVLMYEDWYQEIIRDKWTQAYDGGTFERAVSMIEQDKTAFADAFIRNDDRWTISTQNRSVNREFTLNAIKCKTQADAADYLSEWLQNRVAFMNAYWHR